MPARIVIEQEAVHRLAALGLTVKIVSRAIQHAEAEASTCTAFDPPVMGGFMRYGRTVRFLREDLVPLGWDYDNPRNLCRTINPGREFAIVSTSGDEATGNPVVTPTTKYPKGYATVLAVETNGQLGFDFSDMGIDDSSADEESLATWFLLYHVNDDEIRSEISLPSAMEGGNISDWQERIILPVIALDAEPLATRHRDEGDAEGDGEYVVEVNRR